MPSSSDRELGIPRLALPELPSASDIRALIVAVISQILERDASEIDAQATLDSDLGLESVAFVELQVWLEDELQIEIDPVKVVELNDITSIAEYLHGLVLSK